MSKLLSKIEQVLSIILPKQGIDTFEFKIETAPEAAIGYIGRIVRIIINGFRDDNEPVTLPLICKYPPDDPYERATFNSMKCFEREVYIYNHVIPEFEKLQNEHGIFNVNERFQSYPKCYYAEYDKINDFSILILEDLIHSGYAMYGTIQNPIRDINQVKLLFNEISKFNAISFALRRQRPEIFEKFKVLDNILPNALASEQLTPISVRNCKLALEIIDPNETDKINLIKKISPFIWPKVYEMTDSSLSEPYNVLGHGDIYANNVMFRCQNDKFSNIKLIDFQTVFYCSPVLDLIYFLMSSTIKELRHKYFYELFDYYYDNFGTMLRKLGCDPEEEFPKIIFHQHMQQFGHIGLGVALFAMAQNENYPFEGDKTTEENQIRINNYKSRLNDILDDTIKYFGK